jgi:hypothetical protein
VKLTTRPSFHMNADGVLMKDYINAISLHYSLTTVSHSFFLATYKHT